MQDLLTALALVMVVEGVLYSAFPSTMRRAMMAAMAMPDSTLRGVGLAVAAVGVVAVWLIRG